MPTDCPSPAPAPESVQVSWDMFTVTSLLCQGPTNCHWPVVTSFLWWSVIGGAAILTTGDWRSRHSGRRREALVYKNLPKGSPCAVKLVKSYLTKRTMCVRYRAATSSFQDCPGGGPQGGLLTGALFCLQVNKAGRPCIPRPPPSLGQYGAAMDQSRTPQTPSMRNTDDTQYQTMDQTTEPQHPSIGQLEEHGPIVRQEILYVPPCHESENLHKKSFIDDLTPSVLY